MSNQWFRLYHEFATDPKLQMMSEAYQRRYVMVLCLKCCNVTVTLDDEQVAFQLRISVAEWMDTKGVFLANNLIDDDNHPIAWDKRQYISDSSAERVARYRAKQKEGVKRNSNVTVTPPDTDTDTDTEHKKKKTLPQKVKKPDDVDEQVWQDWLTLRKQKKASVTITVLKGAAREAGKAGVSLNEFFEIWCRRGSQGLEAAWIKQDEKQTGNSNGQTSKPNTRKDEFADKDYNKGSNTELPACLR